jgi:hypothetical protein
VIPDLDEVPDGQVGVIRFVSSERMAVGFPPEDGQDDES